MSDPTGYDASTAPAALRPLYRALEPDPGADYGTLLPFARDRASGALRPAMPGMVRDFLTGLLDLPAGVETGEVTPRAAVQLGLGGLGAGGLLAPRNALAAGGARFGRPVVTETDRLLAAQPIAEDWWRYPAQQQARARALGFNVDRPLYHGTPAPDFPVFRAAPPWEAVRKGSAPDIWTAENPEVAERFSFPQSREAVGLTAPPAIPESPEGTPRILPLLARSSRTGNVALSPRDDWGDIWRTVAHAFDSGYDAVRFSNYRMFPELGPQTIWSFRDPNQLRSRFARFDPAQRDSADLMAGMAAPAPVGFNVQPAPAPGLRVDPELLTNGLRRPQDRVY